MNARRYELNADAAFDHFLKSINGSNELSKSLFKLLDLKKSGCFFTILPNEVNVTDIHKFEQGGLVTNLKGTIGSFLLKLLLRDDSFSFVFDEVLESPSDLIGCKLFTSNGFTYKDQAYYVVQSAANPNLDLINECLEASNTEWHCLGVLTCICFDKLENRELTTDIINDICINAKFIITTSYDGEGYIFWEKRSESDLS